MCEEIHVSSRPVWRSVPEREEHGSFQDESIADGGLSEAVEQPFDAVPHEHGLHLLSTLASAREEALVD